MSVKYCSTVCQKKDWVNLEKVCGVIKFSLSFSVKVNGK